MIKATKQFFGAILSTPTITDAVTHKTHAAVKMVRDANADIERARFQRHMAISELIALEAWNHQRGVLEEMPRDV